MTCLTNELADTGADINPGEAATPVLGLFTQRGGGRRPLNRVDGTIDARFEAASRVEA